MTSKHTSTKSLKIRVRIPDAAQSATVSAADQHTVRPWVWMALGTLVCVGIGIGLWPADEPVPELENTAQEVSSPPASTTEFVPEPAPAPATLTPANPDNRVLRALITDSMRNQNPGTEIGPVVPVSKSTRRFYFFTEVEQPVGKKFAHLWQHEGKTTAHILFQPHNSPWRASSNKRIPPHLQGRWRAVLVDEHDKELASTEFVYGSEARP